MNLIILRTDIRTRKMVRAVQSLLNNHPVITSWSIDMEDVDKVLRIEALDGLAESDVISLIRSRGFHSEALPD